MSDTETTTEHEGKGGKGKLAGLTKHRETIGIAAAVGVLVLTYLMWRRGSSSSSSSAGGTAGIPGVVGAGTVGPQTAGADPNGTGNLAAMFSGNFQNMSNQLGELRTQQEAQFGYLNTIQGGVQAGLQGQQQIGNLIGGAAGQGAVATTQGGFLDHYWNDPAWTPGGRWYRRPAALKPDPNTGPWATMPQSGPTSRPAYSGYAGAGPSQASGRLGMIGTNPGNIYSVN